MNLTYYLIFETLQHAQNIKLVINHQSYKAVWTPVSEGKSLKAIEFLRKGEAVQWLWWVSWRQNFKQKKTSETMWETQPGKFTTSKKVNIDIWLPEFSAKK